MNTKKFVFGSCFGLLLVNSLTAQEVQRFSFGVGAGFTNPAGPTGRELDSGWNIRGGAGFNFSSYLGAMVQLDYNAFGINGTTLNNLGFPGGDLHVFSATLNPIVHLNPRRRFNPYIIGCVVFYPRHQESTQPAFRTLPGFDPIFGCYTATVTPTPVLASEVVKQ